MCGRMKNHLHPGNLTCQIKNPKTTYAADEHLDNTLRIGIIGFGPKGLYALERILSESKASGKPVSVTCFNTNKFWGMGPNYNPDQPSYLLLNYSIRMVNAFSDDAHQLLQNRPTLVEFYNRYSDGPTASGDEWCSRSLVGCYLNWVLNELLSQKPPNAKVSFCQKKVTAVVKSGEQYDIDGELFDASVITTGHAYEFENPYPDNPRYINHIYPIDQVEQVDGSTVGVLGLGLTFVDAVLGLTEGRGGTFNEDFSYQASGREPKQIFAFSGSGQMMIPRTAAVQPPLQLQFLTEDVLDDLAQRRGKIDWDKDILPLLAKEYEALAKKYRGQTVDFENIIHLPFSVENQIQAYFNEPDLHNAWSAVWRQVAPKISALYAFKGFTAASQEKFDARYFGIFNRMSYGFPDYNARKIQALYQAGILNFDFAKGTRLAANGSAWTLSKENSKVQLEALINARIPKAKDQKLPLFESMVAKGIAQWATHGDYAYHTLEIDQDGCVSHENIVLQGTPTEHFVLDNESLSRNCHNFTSAFIKKLFQS